MGAELGERQAVGFHGFKDARHCGMKAGDAELMQARVDAVRVDAFNGFKLARCTRELFVKRLLDTILARTTVIDESQYLGG